jgi:hypothetical protein
VKLGETVEEQESDISSWNSVSMKKKALAGDLGDELLEGEDKCTPEDEILEKADNGLGGMEIFVSERDNRDDGDQWMVARHKNNKRNKNDTYQGNEEECHIHAAGADYGREGGPPGGNQEYGDSK